MLIANFLANSLANFLAEHHVAIRTFHHLTNLIKAICQDFDIAKKLKCHKTKVIAVIQVESQDI